MKRQTEAHTEHLSESLERQGLELAAHWQMKLYDEIIKERDRNMQDIAAVKGRLLGMQVTNNISQCFCGFIIFHHDLQLKVVNFYQLLSPGHCLYPDPHLHQLVWTYR